MLSEIYQKNIITIKSISDLVNFVNQYNYKNVLRLHHTLKLYVSSVWRINVENKKMFLHDGIKTNKFIEFMIENNKKIHIFSSEEGKILKTYGK